MVARLARDVVSRREWKNRRYLISPLVDFLMVGGAGLILAVLMVMMVPNDVTNDETATRYSALLGAFVTYHIFAINFPHFAASYQITWTRLPYLRKSAGMPASIRWRYWFALVGFPILYVAYCVFAFSITPPNGLIVLGMLVNLMFFTVGWHYCKQCFGILMVLSALKGLYFTKWERRVLLFHATVIWIYACVKGNIAINWFKGVTNPEQYWGVPYKRFYLAQDSSITAYSVFMDIAIVLLVIAFITCLAIIIRSARRAHKLPSLTAALGYFMMYPLLLVASYFHPLWLWILPAVHSLQYWLFVLAYRRGEVAHHYSRHVPASEGETLPISILRWHALGSFLAVAVLIGAIQFSWLPHLLDAIVNPNNAYHTPLLFMMVVHVFVNVHHYFIDNVIWRKENPEVGRNLMGQM